MKMKLVQLLQPRLNGKDAGGRGGETEVGAGRKARIKDTRTIRLQFKAVVEVEVLLLPVHYGPPQGLLMMAQWV